MTITAELADGRRLEFPDGTDPNVIQSTVKRIVGGGGGSPVDRIPGILPESARRGDQSPSFFDQADRIAGLGIRGAGPVAAGALAGAALGAPIGGVGAIPGAMVGAGAMGLTQMIDNVSGMNLTDKFMDKIGIPRPETSGERVFTDVTRGVADAAGILGVGKTMANYAGPVVSRVGQAIASNPSMQLQASAAGAGASSLARENDVGSVGQIAAGLAGSLTVPAVRGVARSLYEIPKDIKNTALASYGNKEAAKELALEATRRIAGDQSDDLARIAAAGGTKYVEGTKPTIAEVIAERNMRSPDKIGGSILRLQKDMTGAVGIEDVLPSIEKQNVAATDAAQKALNAFYGPKMDTALGITKNNQGGRKVPIEGVKELIIKLKANPRYEGLKVVSDSLDDVTKQLEDVANDSGSANAKALQNIRGKIGTIIGKASKDNQSFDKKLNAGVEREVQLAIDEAIESAGGKGWTDVMKDYADSAKNISKQKERLIESKKQAVGIKSQVSPSNLAASDVARPPTLLNRTMMLTNFVMKKLADDANTPVAKEAAKLLADPAEFAKALDRPKSDPVNRQLRQWANRAIMEAMAAQRGEQDQQQPQQ